MVLEGHVLDVDVEHRVPVVLHELEVDGVAEDEGGLGLAVNGAHLPGDVGEVEVLHGVDDRALHLHRAVVGVEHGVRVLLLHRDDEVVVAALVPDTLGPEDDGVRDVVEEEEGRVLLLRHLAHVHLGHVVLLLVLDLGQLVLVHVAHAQRPGRLDLRHEVGVVVGHHLHVQVQLQQLVQSRAPSQHSSLLADGVLGISLDEHGSLLVELVDSSEEPGGLSAVEELPVEAAVHEGEGLSSSRLLGDDVLILVLAPVVLDSVGHVQASVGAHLGVAEGVEQVEGARVP
mmetsp:Transcript_9983/g.16775  ORF Transcript_9983/g.16775 Transcript_9983/m.16775 type:complete len:286 (-) Transcript_9983:1574-2431(-)